MPSTGVEGKTRARGHTQSPHFPALQKGQRRRVKAAAAPGEDDGVDQLIRRRLRLQKKLQHANRRLTRKRGEQRRRKERVRTHQAALDDDAKFKRPSWAHASNHRDSNFTKGLLQSGYRGPEAFTTEKRQSFVYTPLDPAERALQHRDYRSQGEFSHFLNRCISQCYEKRRGIEDPKGAVAAASAMAYATRSTQAGQKQSGKSKYLGLPLAPMVPERYGSVTVIGVHTKPTWQKLHPQPMTLAFVNEYKRAEEKNRLKGFLHSSSTTS